jgi:hypothetical protein
MAQINIIILRTFMMIIIIMYFLYFYVFRIFRINAFLFLGCSPVIGFELLSITTYSNEPYSYEVSPCGGG